MLVTHLWTDFKLIAQRHADLRNIAIRKTIARPLAKEIYDIYVNRDLSRFDHTKWLAEELSPEYIKFATKDVYASIEIHKKIVPTWIVESFENVSDVENVSNVKFLILTIISVIAFFYSIIFTKQNKTF